MVKKIAKINFSTNFSFIACKLDSEDWFNVKVNFAKNWLV